MAQLITVVKPQPGGDPCELHRTVSELIDQLNALSITIRLPDATVTGKTSPRNIQIDLAVVTEKQAINLIPGYGAGAVETGSSDNVAASGGQD